MAEEFDELVRDGIPPIIREDGDEPVTHVVTGREFRERLHEKLDEEVEEFHETPTAEELADVRAVLDALVECHGLDDEAVEQWRDQKAETHGEFAEGIVLDEVEC